MTYKSDQVIKCQFMWKQKTHCFFPLMPLQIFMYLSPNNTNKHTVFFQKDSIFYHNEFFLLDFSRLQPSVIKRIDLLSYAQVITMDTTINLWEITECGSHLAWAKKLDKDYALYPCLVLEEATYCGVGIVIISILEMRHFKNTSFQAN